MIYEGAAQLSTAALPGTGEAKVAVGRCGFRGGVIHKRKGKKSKLWISAAQD
jgi:hypothetical protein